MQLYKKQSTILLVLALLVSACAGNNAPTEDPQIVMTSAVGTMVASFFETQTAMVTPSTLTPTATETKFPTPTSFATQGSTILVSPTSTFLFYTATLGTPRTPTVTGTLPTATVNSSALAFGCSNLAFVRHVNYPDGTVMSPGQTFTKTWKVENNGTCDWLFGYRLTLLSGDMDATIHGSLGKLVSPGNWAELSATITAPKKSGTYTVYFRFSDGSHPFGATLGVSIKVESSPANTAVPATNTSVPPSKTNTSTNVPPTATFTVPAPTETPTPTSTLE